MIKKGDVVEILPQWRDPGDDQFTWIALGDEQNGRIDVVPVDHPMSLKPIAVVRTDWVRVVGSVSAPQVA